MNSPIYLDTSIFPLVSVVINCLNSEAYVREAIDSVISQTYPSWEIIVWDNASIDQTSSLVLSYDDPRIYYYRGKETVPLGRARNLALAKCSGEFVAFLDSDDLWISHKLEKQIPLFLADPDVGLVYSDTYFFNSAGLRRRLYSRRQPYRGWCFSQLLNDYLLSMETVVIRRSLLDTLSPWFNEEFNLIEEYDLFVRISSEWKIDYVPEVLAMWRVHSSSWTWRFSESFVDESLVMLADLNQNPALVARFSDALASAHSNVYIRLAIREWKSNNPSSARSIIKAYVRRITMKTIVIYLATFFPFSLIHAVFLMFRPTVMPS